MVATRSGLPRMGLGMAGRFIIMSPSLLSHLVSLSLSLCLTHTHTYRRHTYHFFWSQRLIQPWEDRDTLP
jgi:hypothetical protein